ncbi:MAG: hypothetical protein COW16_06160 [Sphingomonadales bacterium CG12_big_fil_rev_8_21_14_0_65_65_10]|nr:MAG: hypothetical protein COW16_06160 [Sphingomonadales bacterium CG12_big_fil_rev_8_21_14_0_65_65_10]
MGLARLFRLARGRPTGSPELLANELIKLFSTGAEQDGRIRVQPGNKRRQGIHLATMESSPIEFAS